MSLFNTQTDWDLWAYKCGRETDGSWSWIARVMPREFRNEAEVSFYMGRRDKNEEE